MLLSCPCIVLKPEDAPAGSPKHPPMSHFPILQCHLQPQPIATVLLGPGTPLLSRSPTRQWNQKMKKKTYARLVVAKARCLRRDFRRSCSCAGVKRRDELPCALWSDKERSEVRACGRDIAFCAMSFGEQDESFNHRGCKRAFRLLLGVAFPSPSFDAVPPCVDVVGDGQAVSHAASAGNCNAIGMRATGCCECCAHPQTQRDAERADASFIFLMLMRPTSEQIVLELGTIEPLVFVRPHVAERLGA